MSSITHFGMNWGGSLKKCLAHYNQKIIAYTCSYIRYQQGTYHKNSWNIFDLMYVALYLQSSYHALGYSASCLSHDFYSIPDLSRLLADNVVKSLQYVPNYRLRFVVRIL